MLIKWIDYLKRYDVLGRPNKAKVVVNNDPRKLGRVKCVIKGVLEVSASEYEYLPWISPQNPYGLGGKPDCSGFSVPEIDSEVTVVFPSGDVYHPYYIGFWQSELTRSKLFDEDYPNVYGWLDSQVQWLRVNKAQEYTEIFHEPSEFMLRLYDSGKVHINFPNDLEVKVNGDCFVDFLQDLILRVRGSSFSQVSGQSVSQVVGNQSIEVVTGNVELKVSTGSYGVQAAGTIFHDAAAIHHNNGTPINQVPVAIADLALQLNALNVAIVNLETKLAELKAKATEIHNDALAKKDEIAKV